MDKYGLDLRPRLIVLSMRLQVRCDCKHRLIQIRCAGFHGRYVLSPDASFIQDHHLNINKTSTVDT